MRRSQTTSVALALVAATVGGTFVLVRTFGSGNGNDRLGSTGPMAVPAGNGLIAYTSRQSGNYDIWTTRPDGTNAHNLTAESRADEGDAAWSPDGSKIAFVSTATAMTTSM